LGIIFMGVGIAKVDEQSISQELGDVTVIASNHLRTRGLIGTYHVPVLFGVELAGESSRVHHITKHHRELPSFRVGRRGSSARGDLRGGLFLHSRLWCWLLRLGGDCLDGFSFTSPHEHLTIVISGKLVDFDEFILQDV
jgi:hypothetical protein